MRISPETGIAVPVAPPCACKHDFRQISRASAKPVDKFTKLLTELIVGRAVAGDSRQRNVISRFAAKIQASPEVTLRGVAQGVCHAGVESPSRSPGSSLWHSLFRSQFQPSCPLKQVCRKPPRALHGVQCKKGGSVCPLGCAESYSFRHTDRAKTPVNLSFLVENGVSYGEFEAVGRGPCPAPQNHPPNAPFREIWRGG